MSQPYSAPATWLTPTPCDPAAQSGRRRPGCPGDDTDTPVIPLPNPGEGGPVYPGGSADVPTIPLPNPGEGGPVYPGNGGGTPVIPLPNPGEGGPVYPGNNAGGQGTIVIPNRPSTARVRFLNATYGYPAFQILVGNAVAVNFLGRASISPYRYYYGGYRTVTVRGTDGYIYIQKTLPFDAGSTSTIAVILRAGGLDLLQISDRCCPPTGYYSISVSATSLTTAPPSMCCWQTAGSFMPTYVSKKRPVTSASARAPMNSLCRNQPDPQPGICRHRNSGFGIPGHISHSQYGGFCLRRRIQPRQLHRLPAQQRQRRHSNDGGGRSVTAMCPFSSTERKKSRGGRRGFLIRLLPHNRFYSTIS